MKPAELRLIAIGLRIVAEGVGREEPAEFPRGPTPPVFLDRPQAESVLFASGDPHYSDYAVINDDTVPFPLWDITRSAFNQSKRSKRSNTRRLVGPNVGLL